MSVLPKRPAQPSDADYVGCDYCQETAVIEMIGYGDGPRGMCHWCADCALQLVRKVMKVMEDLCELMTKGGRHG